MFPVSGPVKLVAVIAPAFVTFCPLKFNAPAGCVVPSNLKYSVSIPFAFDRKEEKTHGEGGSIVGELKDKRVLVIDDVLTAGTALKQSISTINNYGGQVVGSLVALDREEILEGVLARDKIFNGSNVEVMSIA